MRTIIYASSAMPEALYNIAIKQADKTDQQAQKFNRSVMKGLAENGVRVIPVTYRRGLSKDAIDANKDIAEPYYFITSNKTGIRSYLSIYFDTKRKVKNLLMEYPDAIVMTDALNITLASGAVSAAKACNSKAIGIVTDVPGIFSAGLNAKVNLKLISRYDAYVFLTEAMDGILNPKHKPYSVMEGIFDTATNCNSQEEVIKRNEIFTVVYAGSLNKQYGIDTLVHAFELLSDYNIVLHLFGAGDYVDEIKKTCEKYKTVQYFGIKDNAFVMEEERKADLLINPRSDKDLYTKYSFPSKTIEYMSTGTPVLMQPLPGMPEEYHSYVYLYEGDSEKQLVEAVKEIMRTPAEHRERKGESARDFIYLKKNSKAQAGKIIKDLIL